MTEATFTELGGALQRIAALSEKKILETNDAAERRGLEAFAAKTLMENASELLGCWITIQRKYVPLVRGFAFLLGDASALINRESTGPSSAESTK